MSRYFENELIEQIKQQKDYLAKKDIEIRVCALANSTKMLLDENGLKGYIKRMKKAKVKDWRAIVRNTRMLAAERTGNWKVYVELAEEKWNEEDISDAELYSWGVKINQECRDEAIRFKAARWFAFAAMEMEQKERKSGKVHISSYKSFFEKLVDDLVGKKK